MALVVFVRNPCRCPILSSGVGRAAGIMRFFRKDHPRLYLWEKCEEHGLDFDECDRETFHRKSDVRKFVDAKIAGTA
jgi:hypothetical protein